MIQETHIKRNGTQDIVSSSGQVARLYYSGHKDKSIQGVGILVKPDTCEFTLISSRIMLVRLQNDDINTNLISAYAPTSEVTKENPEETVKFYNELTSVIEKQGKKMY